MLEGTSGSLWSSLLLKEGSTMKSDNVTQGFVQLSLENSQGWDCTASLENLSHRLTVPVVKVYPYNHSEPLSF